jgi:hypothetical protein
MVTGGIICVVAAMAVVVARRRKASRKPLQPTKRFDAQQYENELWE